jgi:pimeloyl-ACP methyl ester carboxylesterase
MGPRSEPSGLSVRGGSGGIEAQTEDMLATARLFGQAATETGSQALATHRHLLEPALGPAAALDPAGAAAFTGTLLAALDGPTGLSAAALECGALDGALRAAAAAYVAADQLHSSVGPMLDESLDLVRVASDVLRPRPDALAVSRDLDRAAGPAVDLGVRGLSTPIAPDGTVGTAAGRLGALFDDGQPVVTRLDDAPPAPVRSIHDLMTGLDRCDAGPGGQISITIGAGPSGHRQVIVDIPGTKDWSLRARNPQVANLGTDLRALGERTTTYERGIEQAMVAAGVGRDDDVLLVGHSLGGIVAVNAANRFADGSRFHISHVITAGSPIGGSVGRIPRSTDVLAIENDGDLVPHLDGLPNPDRRNVTTVTVAHNHGDAGANHALTDSYLPAAADIDASGDQSIVAYRDGLRPFLNGQPIRTLRFQIDREFS